MAVHLTASTSRRSASGSLRSVPGERDEARRALLDAVEADLRAVEDALVRLDDGRYGRCDVCGQAIADEVLAAEPTARRCASCTEP